MSVNEKLKKCLDEGQHGHERHKGLRKIKPDAQLSKEYLTKAQHNLAAITSFHDLGYSDWSASAAFYALYHGLLAVLVQRGYESRNQSCTFILMEEWISKGELTLLTVTDVKEIFDRSINEDLEHSEKILDIRERMQYSTKTLLAEEEFQALKKRTKDLFDKIKLELENFILTDKP
ncbi:MAG: HEPN domain-containing protein [Candidatus Woesearchaeota archaeon]|nr:HEPN domain-containing protein [Candidatus Woesearchaeota archaeon]